MPTTNHPNPAHNKPNRNQELSPLLALTNKKESKKQIKKTLKDIMKTSNTKVTLMNN